MRALLLTALVLGGCRESATERRCRVLAERVAECMPPGNLRQFCAVTLGEPPAPGSLLEVAQNALGACDAGSGCRDTLACLSAHGCRALVSGPTDRAPSWQCTAP